MQKLKYRKVKICLRSPVKGFGLWFLNLIFLTNLVHCFPVDYRIKKHGH